MHKHTILFSALLLLLTGCSYAFDESTQEIEIVTPGENGAVCYMYVDGLRYRVHPPTKTIITKSREDLIIDCLAPGNRRNKVVIEAGYAEHAKQNVLNGGIGAVWDAASGALYQYPTIIPVDFTNTPIQPMPLPAHNNPDIRQPEDYPLEEFSPSKPRMNDDSQSGTVEIRLRDRAAGTGQSEFDGEAYGGDLFGAVPSGKGNLQDTAPTAESSSSNAAPTQLYPGQ